MTLNLPHGQLNQKGEKIEFLSRDAVLFET